MDRMDDTESLEDSLAEGIAAVIAASAETDDEPLDEPLGMADLYLEELNRLWAEPAPLQLG